jgi:glycosyltransferase involved in cell wall biosynthesis
VLYIGILGIGYDFDQIMDAAQLVAKTAPNVEFIFHGGGESVQYLKDTIERRKLTNVKLMDKILDSRKDVVALMNSANVLILPMRDFGHPYLGIATKLYEYQAIGKPIICCAEGQPAKYVSETQSGIVVKHGDCKGIAEAVMLLSENPEMAKRLGNNGRKYVEREASIEAIGRTMKQTLESIRS